VTAPDTARGDHGAPAGPGAGPRDTASAGRAAGGAARGRALDGALAGALAWLALAQLGVLRLVGLPDLRDLWLAALAGAAVARWRRSVPRTAAAGLAAALVVVAWTPLGPALLRGCVRRDVPPTAGPADVPADVDAVAVLSGGVQSDGLLVERSVDRLLAGAEWARQLDRPLALAVVRLGRDGLPSEADQRRLAALADRARAVHFIAPVRVTRDEAVGHAQLARRMGGGGCWWSRRRRTAGGRAPRSSAPGPA
jgi:hypothetical protein